MKPRDIKSWLEQAEHLQQVVTQRLGGFMPYSTPLIAEDRQRDV